MLWHSLPLLKNWNSWDLDIAEVLYVFLLGLPNALAAECVLLGDCCHVKVTRALIQTWHVIWNFHHIYATRWVSERSFCSPLHLNLFVTEVNSAENQQHHSLSVSRMGRFDPLTVVLSVSVLAGSRASAVLLEQRVHSQPHRGEHRQDPSHHVR